MSRLVRVLVVCLAIFALVMGGIYIHTTWRETQIEASVSELRKQVMSGEAQSLPAPDELSVDFDPTQNAPIFRVQEVNANKLELLYIWPEESGRESTSATVACKPWDIKMVDKEMQTERSVSLAEMMEQASEMIGSKTVRFTGICGEASCETMVKNCKLLI